MTISLITPTYNSAATLRDTLASVAGQTYRDREYIIVDNVSTDETLKIIEEYRERLKIILISEPDEGIYDALNKGINRATGAIIGILNSDDFYKNNTVLEKIAAGFRDNPDSEACYGDLEIINPAATGKIVRFWKAGAYREKKLDSGWIIPHPTFFVRREIYEKFGAYRTEFRLAGDYELLLRLLKIHHLKTIYRPETLVSMRAGGRSGRNWRQRIKGWRELRLAWKVNDLKVPPFFILRRILFKIIQYL
ncbi:MAG: glycosyltransferase family 2 protein [Patescibacteria group bacterium]|jgi:glycosyltransferase